MMRLSNIAVRAIIGNSAIKYAGQRFFGTSRSENNDAAMKTALSNR
jgi:hypothetical protein